ncbi:MAG: fused MFS/spermidine synthase [Myxococcota bacterium]|jgi:spermidine synthase|nr:fused MFS/spermidine synthase [Myxococcota bacterium]
MGRGCGAVVFFAAFMRPNSSFTLLLVCFFLSGLAGLIYQTAWTREFAFVFGTSNLAVATVLAAYMAGLAFGAGVAARLAHRIRRPLLTYGVLELGVGLAALAVPFAIHASQALYVALLGGQADLDTEGGLMTALFYLVCSFLILMVPTALMGATLPLLVRHAVHSDEEIGTRIGLLYSINTAGAVVGTLAAAFWLLPEFGLRQTILIAAAINGLVFLAAWALSRTAGASFHPPEGQASSAPPAFPGAAWILPLIFASGLASFTYEVLWVRLLEHLLGGSVYAFSTMLASFLMGITLGAAAASRYGKTRERAAFGFAASQLGIAAFSLAAFLAVDWIPDLTDRLRSLGYSKLLIDWTASTLTLFPAATLIGATFPLAVRVLARDEADAGGASARVYAVNTLGSVVGSIGAGFFVIPALGYAGTLTACVALNLLLGLGTALAFAPKAARPLQGLAVVGVIALLIVPPGEPWKILRYSALAKASNEYDDVAYLGVGRAATVLLLDDRAHWTLRTNGNPEGRISPLGTRHNKPLVARWLGAIPSLVRPDARSLLVVGFGGGVALETVPSLVETVDVVELEPEVVQANRSVAGERWRDPLGDPRLTVHLDDARNALTLTDRRFDAIVSQPSHPWSAGASHLYTREFFELAANHLTPDGVFVQWIGLTFVDEFLFESLLATLTAVFENVQVYNPGGSYGVLFVSSNAPFDVGETAARAISEAPEDFAHVGVFTAEDVLGAMLLDEEGVHALAAGKAVNRDNHNLMQIHSPKILDSPLRHRLNTYFSPRDPLAKLDLERFDAFYLLQRLAAYRAEQLLTQLSPGTDKKVGEAIVQRHRGRSESARKLLDEVLAAAPNHRHARAEKLLLNSYRIANGKVDPTSLVSQPLSAVEQQFIDGWRAEAASDWSALEAMDEAFAAVDPRAPFANAAAQLRMQWRIASGTPSRGREAVAIFDQALWFHRPLDGALLRARASMVAGDARAALDSLSDGSRGRKTQGKGKAYAQRAGALLEQIPRDPDLAPIRERVERNLQRLTR